MSLKIKLTASILAFCMVFAFLVVGVFAVKKADFNVGGEISFEAVGINATITFEGFADCGFTQDSKQVADKDKKGSAGEVVKLQDVKYSTHEVVDNASAIASWTGLKLAFDEGKSEASLSFKIHNDATKEKEYIKVEITTETEGNAEITCDGEKFIDPNSEQVYKITFKVLTEKDGADFDQDFSINFHLERATSKIDLKSDANGYYVEMGYTYDTKATPIKWRLVGYYDPNATTLEDRHIRYVANSAIQTGKTGVFVQETLVKGDEKENQVVFLDSGKFLYSLERDGNFYHTETNLSNTYANDYATSDVRKNCLANEDWIQSHYNISLFDSIYTSIKLRTLEDMYKDMGTESYKPKLEGVEYPTDSDVPGLLTEDSLWLLSFNEAYLLLSSKQTDSADYEKKWISSSTGSSVHYRLRSPFPSRSTIATIVYDIGVIGNTSVKTATAIRAAFHYLHG